jgi:hypothetical protein
MTSTESTPRAATHGPRLSGVCPTPGAPVGAYDLPTVLAGLPLLSGLIRLELDGSDEGTDPALGDDRPDDADAWLPSGGPLALDRSLSLGCGVAA